MNDTPELRHVIDVAVLAATVTTEQALSADLWPALDRVVGYDVLGWAAMIPTAGSSKVWPGLGVSMARPHGFQRLAPGRPLVGHVRCDNDQPPRRPDVLFWREYRPARPRPRHEPHRCYQVATSFEADARTLFCVALNRFHGTFSDLDLAVLDLLRPHLANAMVRAARQPVSSRLTLREQQAIDLVARGHTDAAIAHRLGVSRRTVSKHLEHAYRKLGVHDRTSAAVTLVASELRVLSTPVDRRNRPPHVLGHLPENPDISSASPGSASPGANRTPQYTAPTGVAIRPPRSVRLAPGVSAIARL